MTLFWSFLILSTQPTLLKMTPANRTSASPCKPIQKEERGKSSEGKGELPSGANVKDTQVITADLHEVLPSMCYTLGPVDSQD